MSFKPKLNKARAAATVAASGGPLHKANPRQAVGAGSQGASASASGSGSGAGAFAKPAVPAPRPPISSSSTGPTPAQAGPSRVRPSPSPSPAPSSRPRQPSASPIPRRSATPSGRGAAQPSLIAAAANSSAPVQLPASMDRKRNSKARAREASVASSVGASEAGEEVNGGKPRAPVLNAFGLPMLGSKGASDARAEKEAEKEKAPGAGPSELPAPGASRPATGLPSLVSRGADAGEAMSRPVAPNVNAFGLPMLASSSNSAAMHPPSNADAPATLASASARSVTGSKSSQAEQHVDRESGPSRKKRRTADAAAESLPTSVDGDGPVVAAENDSQAKKGKRIMHGRKRSSAMKKKRVETDGGEDDGEEGDGVSEGREESEEARPAKAKRQAKPKRKALFPRINVAGFAEGEFVGEIEDKRPGAAKIKPERARPATNNGAELDEDEGEDRPPLTAEEMRELIDNLPMADLATGRQFGRVSRRAGAAQQMFDDAAAERREKIDTRTVENWGQRQRLRRAARASRNAQRETRREEIRAEGGDEADVSGDEVDSEIEYGEYGPERLTPESSPEPGDLRRRGNRRDEEGEDDEEGDGGQAEEEPEEGEMDALPRPTPPPATDDPLAWLGASFTVASAEEEARRAALEEGAEEDDLHDMIARHREQQGMAEEVELDVNNARDVTESNVILNSMTYGKERKVERWSKEDTENFYWVLAQTGENFTTMALYFPGREAKQLKNKAKREQRDNLARYNAVVLSPQPMNYEYLEKVHNISGPARAAEAAALLRETREAPARLAREDAELRAKMGRRRKRRRGGGEDGFTSDEDGEEGEVQVGEGMDDKEDEEGEGGEEGMEDDAYDALDGAYDEKELDDEEY